MAKDKSKHKSKKGKRDGSKDRAKDERGRGSKGGAPEGLALPGLSATPRTKGGEVPGAESPSPVGPRAGAPSLGEGPQSLPGAPAVAGCQTGAAADSPLDSLSWAGDDFADELDEARRHMLARLYGLLDGRLSGHRLQHVKSVALTARRLAHSHGVDPYLAQVAGILHDWDKKLPPAELWAKVDRYGIVLPSRDERQLPVLHGLTAAASLREELDLPEEVFRAISRHTVGAPDMSPLDMVLFCSDMLEPTRGPRMDALRSIACGPLEVLYARCQQSTLLYLVGSGRYVSPQAIQAWNAYCGLVSQ